MSCINDTRLVFKSYMTRYFVYLVKTKVKLNQESTFQSETLCDQNDLIIFYQNILIYKAKTFKQNPSWKYEEEKTRYLTSSIGRSYLYEKFAAILALVN